jgi:hypothetical protein
VLRHQQLQAPTIVRHRTPWQPVGHRPQTYEVCNRTQNRSLALLVIVHCVAVCCCTDRVLELSCYDALSTTGMMPWGGPFIRTVHAYEYI